MESHWPEYASNHSDVEQFCRMLKERHQDAIFTDCSEELSTWYSETVLDSNAVRSFSSFLMQISNVMLLRHFPDGFGNVFKQRLATEYRVNSTNPWKCLEAGTSQVNYLSTSVMGNSCSCNVGFGGDKLSRGRRQEHCNQYGADKHAVNMWIQEALHANFFWQDCWYKENSDSANRKNMSSALYVIIVFHVSSFIEL